MKRRFIFSLILCITFCISCVPLPEDSPNTSVVSGIIDAGVRVLELSTGGQNDFTVYQGDHIRFRIQDAPAKEIVWQGTLHPEKTASQVSGAAALFQATTPGRYPFTSGAYHGHVQVIAQDIPQYAKILPPEAHRLITQLEPLILDVRNQDEFDYEHLEHAVLIPVQELELRLAELHGWQDRDILIYCATGSRSTRAASLLLGNGFKRIYNMATGIEGWENHDLPLFP